jgi:hypothetical protein
MDFPFFNTLMGIVFIFKCSRLVSFYVLLQQYQPRATRLAIAAVGATHEL